MECCREEALFSGENVATARRWGENNSISWMAVSEGGIQGLADTHSQDISLSAPFFLQRVPNLRRSWALLTAHAQVLASL